MVTKDYIGSDWLLLDNWSVLIKDAQGRGDDLLKMAERLIKDSDLPDVIIKTVRVVQGGLAGLFSKTKERDYLMVGNKDLEHYRMYIGARDYGNNLDVQWYLVKRERGLKKDKISEAIKAGMKDLRRGFVGMNLFEKQDLTAYVTAIHHSLLEAVEKLMTSLGQDFSKIDRKSKGFLGVS